MPKLDHLTPLAKALLKVPCAVEDLTPREAQALYDKGYITSPRVGWLWATRKGVRMQLEIAASVPSPKGRGGGLGGLGSDKPICYPYPFYRFPDNAEWVPVEVLWNLREYDRAFTRPAAVERVMQSLKTFGWVSPVSITYYQHDRTALLGEGNHRVGAAVRLGMKWGLATVYRHMKYPGPRHYTSRAPVPVLGAVPKHTEGFTRHDSGLIAVDAFHGTSRAFTRFSTPHGFPRGFYFTTAYDVAVRYAGAGQQFGPQRVIQARLRFYRPFNVTTPEEGAEAQVRIDDLEAQGYDAIVRPLRASTRAGMVDAHEIAVFRDEQIEQYAGHVNADLKPSDIGLPARPLSVVDMVLDGKRIPGVPDVG